MELGLSRSAWTGSVSRDGAIDDSRLLGELSGDALESLIEVPLGLFNRRLLLRSHRTRDRGRISRGRPCVIELVQHAHKSRPELSNRPAAREPSTASTARP